LDEVEEVVREEVVRDRTLTQTRRRRMEELVAVSEAVEAEVVDT
jgi:hypothetical protein